MPICSTPLTSSIRLVVTVSTSAPASFMPISLSCCRANFTDEYCNLDFASLSGSYLLNRFFYIYKWIFYIYYSSIDDSHGLFNGLCRVSRKFTLLLGVALLYPSPSHGLTAGTQSQICDDRTTILSHLANRYAEAPIALGRASNGGLIEVLTSTTGSTFTIIITMPNGRSCMMAAGEFWEAMPNPSRRGSV